MRRAVPGNALVCRRLAGRDVIRPIFDFVQRHGRIQPIQDEDLADLAYRYVCPIGGRRANAVHDVLEAEQGQERFQKKEVSDDLRLVPRENARWIRVEGSAVLPFGVSERHADQPLAFTSMLCST